MQDVNTLLEQAEFALHEAKQRGKNTYVRYQKINYQAFVKRMDIQERLRRSVEENYKGFELYYQPIVNTRKKKSWQRHCFAGRMMVQADYHRRVCTIVRRKWVDHSGRTLDYPDCIRTMPLLAEER